MAKAFDVARLLVRLAARESEPDPLTQSRLQKLLYYAQGWHLAIFGRCLFDSPVQAWAIGPVVAALVSDLKEHGNQVIEDLGEPHSLNETEALFVRSIWREYRGYSASKLIEMARSEEPWLQARGELPLEATSEQEITPESMRSFFAAKLGEQSPPVEEVYQGLEDLAGGRKRSHSQLFAPLRSKA